MHAASCECTNKWQGGIKAKPGYDDGATGLILAKKAAGLTPYHDHGLFILLFFHMNPCTIAGVTGNIDTSAAHRVTQRITSMSVYDDRSVVHGIANGVLSIAVHLNQGTVQVCAQGVARGTIEGNAFVFEPAADIALPIAAIDTDRS